MTKISLKQLILEKLSEAIELTLGALFPGNRAEAKVWRNLLGLPNNHEFSARTFSATLSRLRKQGLVTAAGRYRKLSWSLTKKGVNLISNKIKIEFPKPDGIPRLVMFDIPESERKKRKWLRGELVNYGFGQLQKSVWLGYCPLPEEFIKLLHDLNLKEKVHIVSINKKGTIETI